MNLSQISLKKFTTKKEKEEAYELGRVLYSLGEYVKSASLFAKLVLSDPLVGNFWRGLASCKQLLQEYAMAIEAWKVTCLLCPEDPFAYFHAAECYISIENKKEALQKLDKSEQLCKDDALLNRIQLLKSTHGN